MGPFSIFTCGWRNFSLWHNIMSAVLLISFHLLSYVVLTRYFLLLSCFLLRPGVQRFWTQSSNSGRRIASFGIMCRKIMMVTLFTLSWRESWKKRKPVRTEMPKEVRPNWRMCSRTLWLCLRYNHWLIKRFEAIRKMVIIHIDRCSSQHHLMFLPKSS